MAAIDKLYVHSYYEYDDLRRWAIVYCPELLFYFYNIVLTYKQWKENCKAYIKNSIQTSKKEYQKLGNFSTEAEAVRNLIRHYAEKAHYECPKTQAYSEVKSILERCNYNDCDWEDLYTFPIMNTPLSIDKKLLWICPVPCIRDYLETQCGYKTKWYHKLFWKGRKYF